MESDGKLVQGNIAAFMRAFGFVDVEAADESAWDAFNALVHREVPRALAANCKPFAGPPTLTRTLIP